MNRLYTLLLFITSLLLLLLLGCSLSETANSESISEGTVAPLGQETCLDSTELQVKEKICDFFDEYKKFDADSFDNMLRDAEKNASAYGKSDSI